MSESLAVEVGSIAGSAGSGVLPDSRAGRRKTANPHGLRLFLLDESALEALREMSMVRAPHAVRIWDSTDEEPGEDRSRVRPNGSSGGSIDARWLLRLLDAGRSRVMATVRREDMGAGGVVAESTAMREVYRLADRVAPTDATVLLSGESGTGKEVVARAIHEQSNRRSRPFLALNCGAIPEDLIDSELFGHERGAFTGASDKREGLLAQASGGTLLLDEIAEMPATQQIRLLRFLENGTYRRVGGAVELIADCRVVAATNRLPDKAVEAGKLRADLYYRLAVFPIHVPPLRDRGPDIPLLAAYFLSMLNTSAGTRKRWSESAMKLVTSYDWPGNVRQLKHAVGRAFILADDEILPADLPGIPGAKEPSPAPPVGLRAGARLRDVEQQLILITLDHFRGNKSRAARALGVSTRTLYNRLGAYEEEKKAGAT